MAKMVNAMLHIFSIKNPGAEDRKSPKRNAIQKVTSFPWEGRKRQWQGG
jgi:hypothetical protein